LSRSASERQGPLYSSQRPLDLACGSGRWNPSGNTQRVLKGATSALREQLENLYEILRVSPRCSTDSTVCENKLDMERRQDDMGSACGPKLHKLRRSPEPASARVVFCFEVRSMCGGTRFEPAATAIRDPEDRALFLQASRVNHTDPERRYNIDDSIATRKTHYDRLGILSDIRRLVPPLQCVPHPSQHSIGMDQSSSPPCFVPREVRDQIKVALTPDGRSAGMTAYGFDANIIERGLQTLRDRLAMNFECLNLT